MNKIELLAPAGNMECLIAAINNGADAVYLGGKKFGARAFSNNFNDEEMVEAIKLAHKNNVKVYVTVNTIIFNEEIEDVINYLKFLYCNHVDAVLMQDIGLINLTHKVLPNLEIHISTQAHNHNEEAIKYFKELGCTRVVFDRESTLEEIKSVNVDIEKEVFVYGALCISYSGNCLFSYLFNGRSANRGMCSQMCRMKYSLEQDNKIIDKGYLLSTKDLNTIDHIKELLSSGISSLKIEGRMKSKEYVAVVVRLYRKIIDSYLNNNEIIITDKDREDLLKTFNREFTDGFLFNQDNIINKKTPNHQGITIGKIIDVDKKYIKIKLSKDVHQEDAIRIKELDKGLYLNTLLNSKEMYVNSLTKGDIMLLPNKYEASKDIINTEIVKTIDYLLNKELEEVPSKKLPIDMSFTAHKDKEIELTIKEQDNIIKVNGPIPEQAKTHAIIEDDIKSKLSKLGNTNYYLNNLTIDIDNNLFINLKDLNEIRRVGIEKLDILKEGTKLDDFSIKLEPNNVTKEDNPKISVLARNESQINELLTLDIDYIYVTNVDLYNKYKTNKNIYLRLPRVIHKFKDYQNENLLCTELGSIIKYRNTNNIISDYYLNVANDYTINALHNLNNKYVTLSIELTKDELISIRNKKNSSIFIYGRPENMIINKDIYNSNNKNTNLIDINNNKYPVLYDGYTHILNNQNINLINELKDLKGFGMYHIELFNENNEEIRNIINNVKKFLI